MSGHTLTVFNGVDVPDDVQQQVLGILANYQPDIYQRDCDAQGFTL
jgi:hypothetical protein